jgi:hypothetical protein
VLSLDVKKNEWIEIQRQVGGFLFRNRSEMEGIKMPGRRVTDYADIRFIKL